MFNEIKETLMGMGVCMGEKEKEGFGRVLWKSRG
jgi:hypothetical protein